MFNCTIYTDAGAFEVNIAKDTMLDGTVIDTPVDAYLMVKDFLARKTPFASAEAVISIEEGAVVKAIVVKEVHPQPQVEVEVAEGHGLLDSFGNFAAEIDYLGNKVQVHGLSHESEEGFKHFLPMMVNGQEPYDVMDKDPLEKALTEWGQDVCDDGYRIVMPPAGLTPMDALDYLTDYMKEVEGANIGDGKDAAAWNGWTGEK